jgi:hypothetical protein
VEDFEMSESEELGTSTSEVAEPKAAPRRDHRTLFIAIAFGIGLALLIGFNMN